MNKIINNIILDCNNKNNVNKMESVFSNKEIESPLKNIIIDESSNKQATPKFKIKSFIKTPMK